MHTIDLKEIYGVGYDHNGKLKDLYGEAEARAKYPKFVGHMEHLGLPFMEASNFVAAWNDAVWSVDESPQYDQSCRSRANIIAPHGLHLINFPLIIAFGSYYGQGTSKSYSQGSTELVVDKDGWIGGGRRDIMRTTSWGYDLPYTSAYVESFLIENFRLVGDRGGDYYDPSYESSGIASWDAGETTKMYRIYAEGFNNHGIEHVRGTPTSMDTISVFQNSLGGVGFIGSDLGTHNISNLSGDDNPCLIRMRPGHGRPGGGTLTVNGVKSETGKRSPHKGQIICDAQNGAYNLLFNGVWAAADYSKVDAMFVINTKNGENDYGGSLTVNNFKGYGYSTLLHDVGSKKRWVSPGDYKTVSFRYHSDGFFSSFPVVGEGTVQCDDRLGLSGWNGSQFEPYDYNLCTPSYSYTGDDVDPPPVPCDDWEVGPWGECIDGYRHRDVFPSPSGCTGTPPQPKPPTEEQCEVEPPPSTYKLVVSDIPNRFNPRDLHHATLKNDQYIFVTPESGIQRVDFHLDDQHIQTERVAPYDFRGTDGNGNANPWNTDELGNGSATIRAMVTTESGSEEIEAVFLIENGSVEPPPSGDKPKVLLVHDPADMNYREYRDHYDQFNIYDIEDLAFDISIGAQNGSVEDGVLNALTEEINTKHPDADWVILMDERFFRAGIGNGIYGYNSITHSVSNGIQYEVVDPSWPLAENPLSRYEGSRPYRDLGTRGCMLLSWEAFQKNKDNFKGVSGGKLWHCLTYDNNRSKPREASILDAAASRVPDNFETKLLDARNGGWGDSFVKYEQDVLFYITGIHKIEQRTSNQYIAGGLGSHLTSYGGCLNNTNSQLQSTGDQMPITDWFKNGMAGADGTIHEPWRNEPRGGLTPQFIDPNVAQNAFFLGRSIQEILHTSISAGPYTLLMGDPLFIPVDIESV